jgi:hypothetical protein
LDGELDKQEAAQIKAAAKSDGAVAARLDALAVPMKLLKLSMNPAVLDAPALPAHLAGAAPSPSRGIWVASAIAASFVIGVAVTNFMRPAPNTGWIATIASYQALYVTETLDGATQPSAETAQVLARAQDTFGVDLSEALSVAGLDFKRAQMLGLNGSPLLQVAYLAEDGTPMALCLKSVSGPDRGPKTTVMFDMAGVSWVENGIGFLLIGGGDTAKTEALSSGLAAVL